MEYLNSLYIFGAIFGIGVLIFDLLGFFNQDSDGDGGVDDGAEDGESDSSSDDPDFDGEDGSDIGSRNRKGSLILKFLSILQASVYFSLGFGVTGIFALYTDETPSSSLIWSISAGIILMIVAKLIKGMQRGVLDSQIEKSDLLMERGEVIVPIEKGKIGKVRVKLEGHDVDRFAKSKNSDLSFSMGEIVSIEEVSDEYLYIEKVN